MRIVRSHLCLFGALSCAALNDVRATSGAEALPPSAEIVPKVIARAQWSKAQDFQQFYSFTKFTIAEELDDRGRVRNKQEKSGRVPAKAQFPAIAARTGGTNASSSEPAVPKKPLAQVRVGRAKQAAGKRTIEIDEDTLTRFNFTPLRKELLNGRPTLVFAFEPKRNLPVKQLQDRVVNRTAGTVWVDEQEYELVKADIRLKEPVSFVGGLIGAVQTLHYVIERTRVDEGVWLLAKTELLVKARQLFSPVHTRKQQQWSDFRRNTGEG